MSRAKLEEFLADRNLLALKLSSGSLGGLLKKRFMVPSSTAALALFPDGAITLFTEGQEVTGKFELTIAKTADFHLRLIVTGLRPAEGPPVNAAVTFA
ncbi:MAG: hypothetical protein ACYTAF_08705, partial [Planctomycetota bacterium]